MDPSLVVLWAPRLDQTSDQMLEFLLVVLTELPKEVLSVGQSVHWSVPLRGQTKAE